MEFKLGLSWSFESDGETRTIEPLLLDLLRAINEGGHLNYAASEMRVSYRHAWGLVRGWEERLGQPLLRTQRGRGAQLTEFALALLKTLEDTAVMHSETLRQSATSASAQLSAAANDMSGALTISCSHSERMQRLRDALKNEFRISLELAGTEQALQRYRRGDADLAGFHLPMGDLGRSVAAPLIDLLDSHRDTFRLLEERTLGLISRTDRPCERLAQLGEPGWRFINRQAGSGTRLIFDGLLASENLRSADIEGYEREEYTHTAVAALVFSQGADVSFGSQDAAREFSLHFLPMVEERFYLVMRQNADSRLKRLVEQFCTSLDFQRAAHMKPDETMPSVAALKRIHNAGFWKGR